MVTDCAKGLTEEESGKELVLRYIVETLQLLLNNINHAPVVSTDISFAIWICLPA